MKIRNVRIKKPTNRTRLNIVLIIMLMRNKVNPNIYC